MTENLAGRGEGLAVLVARWRGPSSDSSESHRQQRLLCADELETALEAAARLPSVGQAPPSTALNTQKLMNNDRLEEIRAQLYGEDDGITVDDAKWLLHAYEQLINCVATPSPQAPQCCCNASWLDLDQRDCPIHGPAATQEQPAGSAGWTPSAKDHMDLKEKFNAHIPATDRNHKGPATLDRISGSPRKVGEDTPVYRKVLYKGPPGHATPLWLISCDEGWRASIVCEGMYEWAADWLLEQLQGKPFAPKNRPGCPSSVPVGEQKQEEGV